MNASAWMLAIGVLVPTLPSQERPQLAAASQTWHVRGRVIDEDGKAIEGACLTPGAAKRLTTVGVLQAPQTRTDATGCFELGFEVREDSRPTLHPDHQILLLAAPGRLAVQLDPADWLPAPHQTLDLGDIALARAITLRATVRAQGGGPIAGARVIATDLVQDVSESAYRGPAKVRYAAIGTTDDKGSVELPGVAQSGARVVVQADGYFERTIPFVTQEPLVVELRAGGFVEGQVTDADGKPCGAFLLIAYEAHDPNRETAAWTADGSFRINLRFPHRYRVTAYHGPGGRMGSMSPVLEGPAKDVEVRSIRTGVSQDASAALVVRIIDDETGKAVENVAAAALWRGSDARTEERDIEDEFVSHIVLGRRPGELRLPGPAARDPDTGIVVVKAKGYAPLILRDVQWSADEPPKLEARLVRESVVSGIVVEEDSGRPVHGASIISGEKLYELPELSAEELGGRLSARDGQFRLGGLGAGKHKLRAWVRGRPVGDAIEVEVAARETLEHVKLVVPRVATLLGRLVGTEIRAGTRVQLRKPTSERGTVSALAEKAAPKWGRLDPEGNFTIRGLARGAYEVKLLVPHREGRGGWIELPIESIDMQSSEVRRDFDLSKAALGKIRGKVSLTGAALPQHRLVVAAYAADENGRFELWDSMTVCEPVGSDGAFEIPAVPGRYRLELLDVATRIPLLVTEQIRVRAGGTAEAELKQRVVAVRVSLQPERAGDPFVAARLEVAVKHDWGPRSGPIGYGHTRAGASLTAGETQVELLLPTLPTMLRVRSNIGRVLGRETWSDDEPLAQREITPGQGKDEHVEITVRAPAKSQK